MLTVHNEVVHYPANLGSRCAPWHLNTHPACLKVPMPDWCNQPFCYVNPCKCTGHGTPRLDPYMTEGSWQNLKVYYSYSTCGGSDTFTPAENPTACVNQKTQAQCDMLDRCSWSLTDGCVGKSRSGPQCSLLRQNNAQTWGSWSCPCIGMAGKKGTYTSLAQNVKYPAETGSTCGAWHNELHPACQGPGVKPSWCSEKWCFVDPCTCSGGIVPIVDNVFPGGDFAGKSLFYSYATCGQQDTYTAEMNPDACSLQLSRKDCLKHKRCAWSFMGNNAGVKCRGIEVATNCAQTAFSKVSRPDKDDAVVASPWSAMVLLLLSTTLTDWFL